MRNLIDFAIQGLTGILGLILAFVAPRAETSHRVVFSILMIYSVASFYRMAKKAADLETYREVVSGLPRARFEELLATAVHDHERAIESIEDPDPEKRDALLAHHRRFLESVKELGLLPRSYSLPPS